MRKEATLENIEKEREGRIEKVRKKKKSSELEEEGEEEEVV